MQLSADRGCSCSIEGDRAKPREVQKQLLDLIMPRLADRLIETTASPCRRNHIP